jgi:hypothetical protein
MKNEKKEVARETQYEPPNQGRNYRKEGAINVPWWVLAPIIVSIGFTVKHFLVFQ